MIHSSSPKHPSPNPPTGVLASERFTPIPDARPADAAWPPLAWPPASDVMLTGEHVRLIALDPERHAAGVFQALDDDATWEHLSQRPRDAGEYAASLAESLVGPLAPGPHGGRWRWAVQLTTPLGSFAGDAFVGTTSFLDVSPSDGRLEIGSTAYARPCWGSAVNPETKLLLLSYAFDELGAGRVQIKTDARNARSQQAIARLGAIYEGTLRRHQRRADGSIRDTVMFSITVEDWPAVRDGLLRRLEA